MASREELQAVLERVEAAYGRDREIDAAIAYVVGEAPEGDGWELLTHSPGRHNMDAGRWLRGQILRTPRPYTASIDAALALVERVLPGWVGISTFGGDGVQAVDLMGPFESWGVDFDGNPVEIRKYEHGEGRITPLAILAALLRALISQTEAA